MPEQAQPEPAESILAAVLLATTGGLLDGFVYLNHGHVFANAMTGNVVLLGTSVLGGDAHQAMRHIAPLLAFFAGVLLARTVHDRLGTHASLLSLALEMSVLFAASLLPGKFPDMLFTAIIAFVSSYQITSFRKAGGVSYNSTFVTGNLRDVALGLYESSQGLDAAARQKGRQQARALGLVCLGFLAGACLGAWSAPHLANHTLWLAEPLLLAVFALHFARNTAAQAT